MEDNYVLAFNCVLERFNKEDELFYFYVCALYGLLCKYSNYKDLVLDIFRQANLYLEDSSICEILKRHNVDSSEYDDDTVYGVSSHGHEFFLDKDAEVKYGIDNPFIACALNKLSIEGQIIIFCHEMGHLIKGALNGFEVFEDDEKIEYYIRTGFAYYYYLYEIAKDELSVSTSYSILDEAINTIETTEVMEHILELKDISVDDGLSNFVNSLDKDLLVRDRGYDGIVEIVRKLWDNQDFRNIVYRDIVEFGIKDAEKLFNDVVGEDKLFELNELLEELFILIDEDDDANINIKRDEILRLISAFNINIKKNVKI